MSQHPPSAVNPLPTAVIGLAAAIFVIECLLSIADQGLFGGPGASGLRLSVLERFAFSGAALDWMAQNRQFPPDLLIRFVSYPLVHASFTQAIFVCVFLLAMGKMVGEAFGNLAVLVVFFGASVGGALVYGVALAEPYPLIGGFPGVYGLIGGFTFMMWVRNRAMGQAQSQAFQLIALLIAIQLVFSIFFTGSQEWIADLAGFACGFGLSFLLVPGGWARLREKLRGR